MNINLRVFTDIRFSHLSRYFIYIPRVPLFPNEMTVFTLDTFAALTPVKIKFLSLLFILHENGKNEGKSFNIFSFPSELNIRINKRRAFQEKMAFDCRLPFDICTIVKHWRMI